MRKRLALLAAFLLVAAVSYSLGGRAKPRASGFTSGSIELGNIPSMIDRQRLLQDLERTRSNLTESKRLAEDLRRTNETLREKVAEQEQRALQGDAQLRYLQDQIKVFCEPDANLDRCDELAQSCRDVVGRCAELIQRFSNRCGDAGQPTDRIVPKRNPPATVEPHGKGEEET